MPVYRLSAEPAFPDPREAGADGLLAVGGDLRPARLLRAYANGIFPWYEEPPILWFSPDPRAVLPPSRLHVPRRLRRTLRGRSLRLSLDTAFSEVIRSCARVERQGQRGTWITAEMIDGYEQLHAMGFAHSVEAWSGSRLVGGVYGVSLGAAFFGESMFHHARDASKAALAALCWQLEAWGFELFDAQVPSPHLASLGFVCWSREHYLAALARAVAMPTRRGPWTLDDGVVAQRASRAPEEKR
jgi:leucyl/phenylalanyl-tRNA--protein transferase